MSIRISFRSLVVCATVVSGVFGLSACEQRPDPCVTANLPVTAEDTNKVNRGLEVDESIESDGYAVECELLENRDGTFTWRSEPVE